MLQTNEEVLEKLNKEKDDLNDKIWRLNVFLASDHVDHISGEHFRLLCIQEKVMHSYVEILDGRISLIKAKL
jgi:hypothetical protein